MDFAGGITIHTTSGIGGLVVALMVQKRRKTARIASHNLIFTTIGCVLIWIGWYSFNAGSALKANEQAAIALINTQIAGCVGGVLRMILY